MRRFSAVAVAAMLCLVSACSSTGGDTGPDGSVGFEGGDGSILVLPPDQRPVAPALSGETLDGDTLSTSDYAGKVLVLNVWGSWCAPCRSEAPALVAAATQMPDVQFIGINTRDNDPAPARAFVRAFGVEYPNLYDRDGSLLLGFGQVPPKAIPSTLVIDATGRVAARMLGEVSTSTLVGVVEDVTAQQ